MAQSRPSDSVDSRSFSRALIVALMVAVLYGAILLAIDAIVTVLTDRDIISEPDAGPLVGPIMSFAAVCIVFVSVLFGLRPEPGKRRVPIVRAIVTGLAVLVVGPLVGAIVFVLGQVQLRSGVDFFMEHLASPFVIVSALLAVITLLLLPAIARVRSRAR